MLQEPVAPGPGQQVTKEEADKATARTAKDLAQSLGIDPSKVKDDDHAAHAALTGIANYGDLTPDAKRAVNGTIDALEKSGNSELAWELRATIGFGQEHPQLTPGSMKPDELQKAIQSNETFLTSLQWLQTGAGRASPAHEIPFAIFAKGIEDGTSAMKTEWEKKTGQKWK